MVGLKLNEAKSEMDPVQDIQFLGDHTEVCQLMGSLNWASGLIPLGHLHLRPLQRHFHSRSDKPVYTTMSIRSFSPCQPTRAMAGPIFSHIWNPSPAFPGEIHFYGRLYPGRGRPYGYSEISGIWTHSNRKLNINTLELKAVILALHHWVSVLQGFKVIIATDNTSVVAYINK